MSPLLSDTELLLIICLVWKIHAPLCLRTYALPNFGLIKGGNQSADSPQGWIRLHFDAFGFTRVGVEDSLQASWGRIKKRHRCQKKSAVKIWEEHRRPSVSGCCSSSCFYSCQPESGAVSFSSDQETPGGKKAETVTIKTMNWTTEPVSFNGLLLLWTCLSFKYVCGGTDLCVLSLMQNIKKFNIWNNKVTVDTYL